MPSIKEQHEIAIGNNLLKFLQCDSQLLRHGKDDGEPELIYSLDSRTVGIEVTTAYYDDGQAKAEWKLARVQVDGAKFSLDNADKLIASRVRQALSDKSPKSGSTSFSTLLRATEEAFVFGVNARISMPPLREYSSN
jgi:hypothetical protein